MTDAGEGEAGPKGGVPDEHSPALLGATLKKAAAAMREADVPFLLCGSLACWARGGPPLVTKDVDLCIKPEDAERALEALADLGLPTERPPEGWLFKAWDEDVLIDLLFAPANVPVTDEILARGEELQVMAVPMRVASIDDVMATKLLALNEHSLDLHQLLQIARSLRERIDWDELRARTDDWPYANAFFALVEALGVAAPPEPDGVGGVRSHTFSMAREKRLAGREQT